MAARSHSQRLMDIGELSAQVKLTAAGRWHWKVCIGLSQPGKVYVQEVARKQSKGQKRL